MKWVLRELSELYYDFNVFLNVISHLEYFCLENHYNIFEARRGAGAQSVTVKPTGCGFDPHSKRWNIYLNLYFHFFALVSTTSAALNSATQNAIPPEFGRKWGTEYLNTRFPLPTLQCAGYSVKLIYWFIYFYFN